jgi:RNA polymerase sigma-70 factor (ECF subfamily)
MDGKALPDEADLAARARQGDREAFTQLVMDYQVPLYNMALRMIGRPEDAADVAQEAFLRAWEKIRSLRNAPFKPWLFQIAVNLCYDHFRRGRRLAAMPGDEEGEKVVQLGAPLPDPEERALARERGRLVAASIESLDHDHRVALVLRDVNGLAYEEIASILGVPLGTVKSRIARAREEVQERLLLYPELFGSHRTGKESSDG